MHCPFEVNLLHLVNPLLWNISEPSVGKHWTANPTGPSKGNKYSQRDGLTQVEVGGPRDWPSAAGPRGEHPTGGPDQTAESNRSKKIKSQQKTFSSYLHASSTHKIGIVSLGLTEKKTVCLPSPCAVPDPPHRSDFSHWPHWKMVTVCTRPVSLAMKTKAQWWGAWLLKPKCQVWILIHHLQLRNLQKVT